MTPPVGFPVVISAFVVNAKAREFPVGMGIAAMWWMRDFPVEICDIIMPPLVRFQAGFAAFLWSRKLALFQW